MRIRVLAMGLVLCVAALLSGCDTTSFFGEPAMPQPSALNTIMMMDHLNVQNYMTLYFPVSDYSHMAAEQRVLTTEGQPYRQAVLACLAGPQSGDLVQILPPNTELLDCFVSESIAFVHFDTRFLHLTERERIVARACLTQTLTTFPEIEYVQILVNYQCMTIGGTAVGPAQRGDGGLPEWTATQDRMVILFFQDAHNNYLIPEVRRIEGYSDPVRAVVAELARGPQDLSKENTLSTGLKLVSDPEFDSVARTLTVELSADILSNSLDVRYEQMAMGSLVLSLTQSVPGVSYVRFLVQGHESDPWEAVHFRSLLGYRVCLFFPNEPNGKLTPVYRAVALDKDTIAAVAEETLRGPLTAEIPMYDLKRTRNLSACLLETKLANGIAEVWLSGDIITATAYMEPQTLRTWAYALVNGIGNLSGVRWTMLCVDTDQKQLHDVLSINTPLLPNPGLQMQ